MVEDGFVGLAGSGRRGFELSSVFMMESAGCLCVGSNLPDCFLKILLATLRENITKSKIQAKRGHWHGGKDSDTV